MYSQQMLAEYGQGHLSILVNNREQHDNIRKLKTSNHTFYLKYILSYNCLILTKDGLKKV